MLNLSDGNSGHVEYGLPWLAFLRLENSEGSEVHRVHLAETRTKSRCQRGKSNSSRTREDYVEESHTNDRKIVGRNLLSGS